MTKEEMSGRIAELSTLVNEIEGTRAWQIAMNEISSLIDELDGSWQNVDEDRFYKMQVTKRSFQSVLYLVDTWKAELEELQETLAAVENPDIVQNGDFDNE